MDVSEKEPSVEGFSASNPVPDEDWLDFVRWDVNTNWHDQASLHPLTGFFAQYAGSNACVALGHVSRKDDDWEDVEGHPMGFGEEFLCIGTAYGVCCTVCESDDCPILNRATDTKSFWRLFSSPETER